MRPASAHARYTLIVAAAFCGTSLFHVAATGQEARLLAPEPITAQASPPAPSGAGQPKNGKKDTDDLFNLDLQRLLQTPVAPTANAPAVSLQQEVSTVSRQASSVARSPAAVFVITQEMIRRSTATSVPELLRMVPGLDVARVDSSRWAISSRGFNSRLTDKMLVQVDGRTIYQPIFSGVFWETLDLIVQDIERIEVIRGPGATVWGANAVNGVINIITKRAQDTQGGLATGGGGNREQGMAGMRYGGKLGDDAYYRVWGKWSQGGTFYHPQGGGDQDDWRQGHGGFRFDWQPSCLDTFTLQGELFRGDFGRTDIRSFPLTPFVTRRFGDDETSGGNVVGRWRHEFGERSDWVLQTYFDNFHRDITTGFAAFDYNTFDVDFQQQFPLTPRQQLIYGLAYRFIDIDFRGSNYDGGFTLSATGPRQVHYYSAFVQDEFTLVKDHLFFTAGCKFLENSFSGFEYQPTGRLLWAPDERRAAWAAVSRAVRTPNYSDQNITNTFLPTFPPALGGAPQFTRTAGSLGVFSEDLIAYEAGYRSQVNDAFSFDLAAFCNIYDNLVTIRPQAALVPGPTPGSFILPAPRSNGLNGESYGVELAANWKVTDQWRIYGNYTFCLLSLHRDAGLPASAEVAESQSPRNQVYVQSSWDLSKTLEFDLIGRYVESLPGFDTVVPSYIALDARLGWRPNRNLEVAIIGQNLLDSQHLEFGAISRVPFPLVEIPRGVYGTVTWRW